MIIKDIYSWIFRFIKGMLIGTGGILPGVSGGALAAVFGVYERIIGFMAHITKDFKKNVLYLLPIGLGALFGVFLLSVALSYFFEKAETQIIWFFIGAITGIVPALLKQAGKKGRAPKHIAIAAVSTVVATLFLIFIERSLIGKDIPLNFATWTMAGGIFGLGIIIPGLSPSNFLVFLDMYKPMTEGIKNLDMSVIVPLAVGGILTVLLLSRLVSYLFSKAYTGIYHFILGVVFASTIMIIPFNYDYISTGGLMCIVTFAAGILLGTLMNKLEDTYKPEA